MLQWPTVFKNICCFMWLLSFPDGFSVRSVKGMLYNPLWGSWSWVQSTSLNYALHAVRAGARPRSHATDTLPQTDVQQRSATAGAAGTVPDSAVWLCADGLSPEQKVSFYSDGHNKTFANNKLPVCINNTRAIFGQILRAVSKNQVPTISGIF